MINQKFSYASVSYTLPSNIFTVLRLDSFAGIVTEEVVVQSNGYLKEKFGVDGRLLKYVVYVRTFAIDLSGQPGRSPFLTFHNFLDYVADMYHKGWNHSCPIINWGTAKRLEYR